jgi:hypothetical protein
MTQRKYCDRFGKSAPAPESNERPLRGTGRIELMMAQITLDVPEDILLALKSSPETIGEERCLIAAVKLFELGRLSSGAA